MEIKLNDVEKYAMDMFYESSIYSKNLPIDVDYVRQKVENISKENIINLIIYNLNNFPNIYSNRFILCVIDYLILFNLDDWINISNKLENKNAVNTFISFFYSYIGVLPNQNFIKKISNKLEYDYLYENDDEDFINDYSLQEFIIKLRYQMLSLDFKII